MAQGRSLWGQVVKNFINSLKPKKYWGELRGKDYMGTEYFEAPVSLQGHKKPSRWFAPKDPENFEQEIPPEWESWLRHRRKDPPTEEEIEVNRLKMLQTIENAKKLEAPSEKQQQQQIETKTVGTKEFPVYEEYCEETGFSKEIKDKK